MPNRTAAIHAIEEPTLNTKITKSGFYSVYGIEKTSSNINY
jgi:hypothetical protein